MAVYIVGFTSYGIILAFYAAIFPRLARNTRSMRELREIYDQGRITTGIYEQAEALEMSKISNLSMARALPSPTTSDCDDLLLFAGYSRHRLHHIAVAKLVSPSSPQRQPQSQ